MKPGQRFLRKLLYLSPIVAVALLFQNFDDNQLFDDLPAFKKEEKKVLSATTLSAAAEEVFLTHYAPEARMFTDKMNERVRVGFEPSQWVDDGSGVTPDQQQLRPEMRLQVIGERTSDQGPKVEVVNADRLRLAWGQTPFSCEYSPQAQTLRIRAPFKNSTNLQYEHEGKSNLDRLSLQISW